MADWLARLSCPVVGHRWIMRQYHDGRTHEFRVCQRCGRINGDPVGHARPPPTCTARLKARMLDLTFKEFGLLKFLARHPGRVFSRSHRLKEVWGYHYLGGTRTVDVHVRRLRARLGPEYEAMIGTVRNVGYKLVTPGLPAHGGAPAVELADDEPEPFADEPITVYA